MNNLTTRKIVLGMLMTLVLALGMQGTAEAITKFTKTSSTDNQVVSKDQPFTIRFSVSLQGNTTLIKDGALKLIKDSGTDGGAANHRISSSGYLVFDATDGNEYRTIPSAALANLELVVDPRPEYSAAGRPAAGTYYVERNKNVIDSAGKAVYVQTGGGTPASKWVYTRATAEPHASLTDIINGTTYSQVETNPSGNLVVDPRPEYSAAERPATNTYYVDSSKRVVDSAGKAVYIQTGNGNPASKWVYTRATAEPNLIVPNANRYHYNEESISITGSNNNGGAIIFTKGRTEVTSLSEDAEESDERLSASISLSCQADEAGVYTITIRDTTDGRDQPVGSSAAEDITFTITVLQDANTARAGTLSGLSDDIVREFGTTDLIATVTSSGSAVNVRVEFEITRGPGSLSAENTIGSKTSKKLSTVTDDDGEATVTLDPKKRTNHVRAWIFGNPPGTEGKSTEGIYIYRWASLNKVSGDSGDSGDPQQNQKGPVSSRLEEPFVVQLFDSTGITTIPGAEITFTTATASPTGSLSYDPSTPTNLRVSMTSATTATVKTDSNGKASIFLVLGDETGVDYTVTAAYGPSDLPFDTQTFTATPLASSVTPKAQSITKVAETDGQSANEYGLLEKPLTVVVRDQGGQRLANTASTSVIVRFVALDGGTIDYQATDPGGTQTSDHTQDGTIQEVPTDASGEASIRWSIDPDIGGRRTVRASIKDTNRSVVFTINGTPSSGGGTGGGGDQNTILITLSSTTGEPGEEVTVNVASSPSGVFATLGSNDFEATRFSPQSGVTPFASTLLLPVEEGTHSFFATGGVLTAGTASVTVESELGTLSITAIGTPAAGAQTFSISAVDADGDRASAPFTARLSGTGFTSRNVEIAGGRGNARVTLPTAARLYTLTVSATGYIDGSTPVRITADGQVDDTDDDTDDDPVPPPPEDTGGEPDSIEITGPSTRSGTVDEELDTPLLVRVLDDDGDGLEGARVFYRVISGRGRLSARGNGRAIGVVTDEDGYARASFTPLDGGTITVRANTDDLSATVTFTITTGAASSASGARDSGTGGTPGMISPVVHVVAASRPPMLWVDGGVIYALVGASPQRFAASVDNALNITVGGGKVYWTEKTGESGGTINSANLNGSDVTELASIMAVPMGIAVDTAGSKLYWTNSRGRIQSADLDGSGITNVIPGGLESPMDLALAGGNAYWTQGNGSVRFVNLRGAKQIRNVSTGTDTPGSIVIGGGKVYWTETTGESGGTVNSANLNGTGATPLASILAAPIGIAVDGSRSKLYWTNARGRVQSANLDGSGITNVVSGLGSPGELVLSNSITAPAGAGSSAGSGTTASGSKYDVNGDGSVNNADSDAITVAIAAGATDAKYDVNGDGTVNVFDLVEIIANRDPGAAGAPTLFGMKMSAIQIDSLQEQIDLLIATNDRSPAALRTLIYLQQLLVTARPEKTQLLANYPNPFNPETWIPYELATDTDVRITIYNTQGVVIRTLQLGHQSGGYYTGRDRAAYWDGRNALGEQVASGLYFYQLETDEMSLMRKMVILK